MTASTSCFFDVGESYGSSSVSNDYLIPVPINLDPKPWSAYCLVRIREQHRAVQIRFLHINRRIGYCSIRRLPRRWLIRGRSGFT